MHRAVRRGQLRLFVCAASFYIQWIFCTVFDRLQCVLSPQKFPLRGKFRLRRRLRRAQRTRGQGLKKGTPYPRYVIVGQTSKCGGLPPNSRMTSCMDRVPGGQRNLCECEEEAPKCCCKVFVYWPMGWPYCTCCCWECKDEESMWNQLDA